MFLIDRKAKNPLALIIIRSQTAQTNLEEVRQGTGNRSRYYDEDMPWALQAIGELIAKCEADEAARKRSDKEAAHSKNNTKLLLQMQKFEIATLWQRVKFVVKFGQQLKEIKSEQQ